MSEQEKKSHIEGWFHALGFIFGFALLWGYAIYCWHHGQYDPWSTAVGAEFFGLDRPAGYFFALGVSITITGFITPPLWLGMLGWGNILDDTIVYFVTAAWAAIMFVSALIWIAAAVVHFFY